MNLLIVGINHNSAPVELREKVAFTPEQLGDALHDLRDRAELTEIAILSTCNRTEIITTSDSKKAKVIIDWLANYHQVPISDLSPSIYTKINQDAVLHAMRVACGLDSMVVGEPQILGQFKDCFEQASRLGTMGPKLLRLSQTTFRIAKRVRTDTAIGESSVSVAATAVTLAEQLFSDLSSCHVLLIGAGETIELVSKHIYSAGIRNITIANRTLENAKRLAGELAGDAIDLQSIPHRLINSDIVITSTSSQLPILGKGTVERALKSRKYRPILMVDLAVPRDIEPEVGELRDVYLYSIDDLQEIIELNLDNRKEASADAEAILAEELILFNASQEAQNANGTLVMFRQLHNEIKDRELEKAHARLKKGDDPEQVINTLANQLTNKIIHTPSIEMKNAASEGRQELLDAITTLYQLPADHQGE